MKILLASYVFSPGVGGIETCSLDLAEAFRKAGHEVQIVTHMPSADARDDHGFQVFRSPSKKEWLRLIRWCDVYFQSNISLKDIWPLAFARRPWVVVSHTWIQKPDGRRDWADLLKRWLLRFAANIYVSEAMGRDVGYPGTVIPNPYDSGTFRKIPGIERGASLVFVGRLVSDKGCDVLIDALAKVRDRGVVWPLRVVGTGPEEASLKSQIRKLGLQDWVSFAGMLRGEELARELNRHTIMVVPSRWKEPFGLVALEGQACGCFMIGSEEGGLREAVGPGGRTFPNGNAEALAEILYHEMTGRAPARSEVTVDAHLQKHRREAVGNAYLKVFQNVLKNSAS